MATRALSADAPRASLEITPKFPPVTRRAFAGMAAIGAAAMAAPSAAASAWSAVDWLGRWHDLGCGVRLDGQGNIQFTMRQAVGGQGVALLAEVGTADRVAALRRALQQMDMGCAAMRQVERLEQIDREFVSEDDDPAGNAAWTAKWGREYDRLAQLPATSGRGLAAKLRQGVAGGGSDAGDRIIDAALMQLERWR